MPNLLRIDASARTIGSHSRNLANELQDMWLHNHPKGLVQHRDLVIAPIAALKNETIAGFYTAEENLTKSLRKATSQSDELIAELMNADALLISTPMYNFTLPAVLKAWIDQVVRIHKTFGFSDDGNPIGLVKGKTAYITIAMGAQFTGTALESMDFLRPYLKSLLGFIGFEEVEFFVVESTVVDEEQRLQNIEKAHVAMANLFSNEVA